MAGRLKQLVDKIIALRLDLAGNPEDENTRQFYVKTTLVRISMKIGRDISAFTNDTPDNPVLEEKIFKAIKELGIVENQEVLEKYGITESTEPVTPPKPIRFKYKVKEKAMITVNVFDTSNKFIRNLLNEMKDAGEYSIVWDTKDQEEQQVVRGEYNIQVINNFATYKKIRFQLK